MSDRPHYRRRKTVVDRSFQFKFAAQIFLAQFVAILTYQAAIQLRISSHLRSTEGFLAEQLLRELFSESFYTLLVIAPIVGFLVALLSLRLSLQIVGPIPRLRRALRAVADGDYTVRLGFRPGDALVGVDQDFNAAAEALESRHGAGPNAAIDRGVPETVIEAIHESELQDADPVPVLDR